MAIEDILKTLDEQAQADCDAVIGEAREHAKLIVEEAEREATRIHEGFVKQIERVAAVEAGKKVNAARLDAKMAVSSVKGNAVSAAFDAAGERLASLRDGAGYDALFTALIREALEGLEGPVTIKVAPADLARAQQIASTLAGATVDSSLQSAGGVMVEANGGRVVRRNTLEDRLDRTRQLVQADVARVLFS
jgi:vacuolar-type H+-ATPase subunit E/Vma4